MPAPGEASPRTRSGSPGAGKGGSRGDGDPTVLLVGADKSFHTAIAGALAQHGVYVETTPAHGVVDAVVAAAPDLVLLVGEAAQDGGSSVLAHLHASPHSSVVPVAILADEPALDERLRAFRHGAAAVIPRSASVDAIADRIAKLAREIPDRDGGTVGYVGEATLDELVQALSRELRSGILSVKGPKGSEEDAIRVVLGGGRPLAQTIDEFVSRIRKHVVHAEPLQYEFDERAGGTVQLLGADALDAASSGEDVGGLRVLLGDEDAARADAVAQALRGHGATVVVTDFAPPDARFARLRQLDPAIVLIDEPGLKGAGYPLVRRMRRDTRLRWASLLVVRWDEIWSEVDGAARIARTLGTLVALAEPENALRERVERGTAFDTRLEITGPTRLLRAVATSPHPVRITVHNPRVQVRVELSDQLVAGARGQPADGGPPLDGAIALSALLVLGSGRVHVERITEPDLVNIMSPVDVALNLADAEASPIQPSLPPADSLRPEPEAAEAEGAPRASARRSTGLWLILVIASVIVGVAIAVIVVQPARRSGAPLRSAPAALPAATRQPAPAAVSPAPARQPAAAAVAPAPSAAAAPAPSATEPAPSEAAPEVKDPAPPPSEADVAGEVTRTAPSCEDVVGPSFALLGSNQPGRALGEIGLGRRSMMLGRLDEAQAAFCRAAVLDPTRSEAFEALVRIYLLRRDAEKARDWAERAAKQHPGDPNVQGLYGDALARAGDADRARAIWLGLGKIDAADAPNVRALAYTYERAAERSVQAADHAQGDRYYRRALLLDPLNASAAAGLARVLLVQGEKQAALGWAKRAVALDPRDPELHVMLGDVSEKTGDLAGARAEWKSAYEIDPQNFRAASRMLRAK